MKPTSDSGKAAATADPSASPVAAPATPPAKQDRPRGTIAEWTITILLLLFGTTFLVQAFVIPTGSMEDTLLIGDHLLVDKLSYSYPGGFSKYVLPYESPRDGDIIVFRYPVDITQTFVKRVVGVPGDRIKLIDQQVYRNGKKLVEPYVVHKNPYPDSFRDNFPNSEPNLTMLDPGREMLANNVVNGEVVVPADSYFAMGDNRDNSLDSRYWGFVPRDNIIGKPLIIYWSYNASTESLASSSVTNLASHFLDLAEHFFTKTRWDRTFRLIHGYYNYN
ncbi:MAG TPA: signal peptidase I [Bryobacteraceae bacterium]|jgi:signal peptidase I|nr:signal peptidase I [Bryobacteraceae bacterium]